MGTVRYNPLTHYTTDENGCWLWLGALNTKGYGVYQDRSRKPITRPAHRYVYEKLRGAVPAEIHLGHKCLNKRCINPDHMVQVTAKENNREGRSATLLSVEKVREIKKFLANGELRAVIAKRYNVSIAAITDIALGRRWTDVRG